MSLSLLQFKAKGSYDFFDNFMIYLIMLSLNGFNTCEFLAFYALMVNLLNKYVTCT